MEFIREWWVNTGLPVLLGGIFAGVLIVCFSIAKEMLKRIFNKN